MEFRRQLRTLAGNYNELVRRFDEIPGSTDSKNEAMRTGFPDTFAVAIKTEFHRRGLHDGVELCVDDETAPLVAAALGRRRTALGQLIGSLSVEIGAGFPVIPHGVAARFPRLRALSLTAARSARHAVDDGAKWSYPLRRILVPSVGTLRRLSVRCGGRTFVYRKLLDLLFDGRRPARLVDLCVDDVPDAIDLGEIFNRVALLVTYRHENGTNLAWERMRIPLTQLGHWPLTYTPFAFPRLDAYDHSATVPNAPPPTVVQTLVLTGATGVTVAYDPVLWVYVARTFARRVIVTNALRVQIARPLLHMYERGYATFREAPKRAGQCIARLPIRKSILGRQFRQFHHLFPMHFDHICLWFEPDPRRDHTDQYLDALDEQRNYIGYAIKAGQRAGTVRGRLGFRLYTEPTATLYTPWPRPTTRITSATYSVPSLGFWRACGSGAAAKTRSTRLSCALRAYG